MYKDFQGLDKGPSVLTDPHSLMSPYKRDCVGLTLTKYDPIQATQLDVCTLLKSVGEAYRMKLCRNYGQLPVTCTLPDSHTKIAGFSGYSIHVINGLMLLPNETDLFTHNKDNLTVLAVIFSKFYDNPNQQNMQCN